MTAPPTLSKVAFTADSIRLPEVQSFTCGTAIYETEISDWIKHTDGALKEIAEGTAPIDWAAAEALAIGRGGASVVARATGVSRRAIRRGISELEAPGAGPLGRRWGASWAPVPARYLADHRAAGHSEPG